MADAERPEEERRRARPARREPATASRSRRRPATDRTDTEDAERRERPDDRARRNGHTASAGDAARRAAEQVAALTGHDAETVISIEPCDEGWRIGIEVVETHRIPDSADILATYEVRLEADGELVSYRRIRRYARGQLHGEGR